MATTIFFFLLLLLLLLLPLFIQWRNKKKHHAAGLRFPPGPPRLPIIGNLHQLRQPLHHCFTELSEKHSSPILGLLIGGVPAIVVSSPELAKEVMKTQDLAFCSRPERVVYKAVSYGGLDVVTARYGDHWRELRKLYSVELLGAKKVLSFRPAMEEEVGRMIRSIADDADATGGGGALVDVSGEVERLTHAIILRVAFGGGGGGKLERRRRDECLGDTIRKAGRLSMAFFAEDYFPGSAAARAIDRLLGLHRRLDAIVRRLDEFYDEVIAEHEARMKQREIGEREEEDITDVLLRLKEEDPSFTTNHIKGALMNVIVAGTDTAATTLEWAMAELANNPRAMKRATEEARTLLAAGRRTVGEEDLARLEYLKAAVNETLRLHPPLPLLIPREAMRRCELGGYDVPPSSAVFVNVWAIGRDPRNWRSAEEFSPERFMATDNGGLDYKGQCFEFLPFGSGRRICPGMQMGTTIVELALANLLCAFDWELPAGAGKAAVDMEEGIGVTTHKKKPLQLVATRCTFF